MARAASLATPSAGRSSRCSWPWRCCINGSSCGNSPPALAIDRPGSGVRRVPGSIATTRLALAECQAETVSPWAPTAPRGLALRAVEAVALAVFKGQRAPVAGVQGMAPEQPLAQRRRDQGLMLRRRAVQRLRGRLQVAKGIDLRRAPRRPCSEGGGQLGRQGTHALAQAFGPQRRAVELGARAIHRRRQGARLEEAEQWP